MKSNTYLTPPETDAMGNAIADYARTGKAAKLIVTSTMLDDDEIAAVASAPAPASDIASAACRAGGADNVTVVTVDVEA